MSVISTIVNKCNEVLKNPKLYINEWKKEHPEGKVVGYFPTYIPEEVLYAANILPVGVFGSPISVKLANTHVQQITCSIVRTTTELKLSGKLDILDGMLFPPTCDSVQLIASIWDTAFKDFKTDMVLYPAKLSNHSIPYIVDELNHFITTIENRYDVKVSEEKLNEAIDIYNENRKLIKKLSELRAVEGFPLNWHDYFTILKAGTMIDKQKHNEMLTTLIDEIGNLVTPDKKSRGIKLMVVGVSCQIPHENVLYKVEKLGATVVWDDFFHGTSGIKIIESNSSPLERLAQAYVESEPMAYRHSNRKPRHEYLMAEMERVGANGVVFMIPKFCEPELFDYAYLKKEFDKNGIRNLFTDFEEESTVAEGFETRLQAFIEMIDISLGV